MKRTIGLLVVVIVGVVVMQQFGGEANSQDKRKKADKAPAAPYVHAVIFYLKKDAPKNADEKMIEDAHTLLAKIPTVRSVRAGHPAKKHTPEVAVTDYSLGLLVIFDDAEGLQTYLEHDLHTEYLKRHKNHVDKVLVYDFADRK